MKILFVSAEVAPYSKSGGLGDVARALPIALAARGHEVMVVTPRYGSVKQELQPLDRRIKLRFPYAEEQAELYAHHPAERVQVVFLHHPYFFFRSGLYGDKHGDFGDNARRFSLMSIGALSAAQHLGFAPDVIHLNDWQTGPGAVAARRGYAGTPIGRAGVVFTIHNLAYQGVFPKSVIDDLGFPWDLFTHDKLEYFDAVSFMKAGIAFADAITTVSERYAHEIQTPDYGCTLDPMLRERRDRLFGILNGVDPDWNPATDPLIPARFSPDAMEGKAVCKRELRRAFGLPDRPGDRPLFGLVSRLTGQKGIELVLRTLPVALERDLEVVLLGSGEGHLENGLRELAARFPGRVGVRIGFDNPLSHLVEAGSDFFLMPSVYEPCGLNQMYSLRYGTLPIVRATGGLDDTVRDFREPGGNGIKFNDYLPSALLWAIGQALALWSQPMSLAAVRQVGMREDFSWDRSAAKYERLYRSIAP
jgi:starch synthase